MSRRGKARHRAERRYVRWLLGAIAAGMSVGACAGHPGAAANIPANAPIPAGWVVISTARATANPALAEDDRAWNCYLDGTAGPNAAEGSKCGPADFIVAGCVGYATAPDRAMCPNGSVLERKH